MARYENLGVTIGQHLWELSIEDPARSKKLEELFENRLDFLVYQGSDVCYTEPYMVQFLKNEFSNVTIVELASLLKIVLRQPQNEKIWVIDCINPFKIPYMGKDTGNCSGLEYFSENEGKMQVVQDDFFLLGIMKEENNDVKVYIYKK